MGHQRKFLHKSTQFSNSQQSTPENDASSTHPSSNENKVYVEGFVYVEIIASFLSFVLKVRLCFVKRLTYKSS